MDWSTIHHPAFWGDKELKYPNVPKEHAKFSESVVVGNLVFVSGCTGKKITGEEPTPYSVSEQVFIALDNARVALENAGSSMENIVKTFSLIRDLSTYGEYRKAETDYYELYAPALIRKPPAATLMVYPGLALPEFKLEYEIIAAVNRKTKDWEVSYYPEFWSGKELAYPQVPKDHAKFARTQLVGQLVFVSGCQALDHNTVKVETMDFAEQAKICLEKIRIGMEETGGSWKTVAKTNVFIKNVDLIETYRQVEKDYFRELDPAIISHLPASTTFVVSELPREEFLVEIEAFGLAGDHQKHWPIEFYAGDQHRSSCVRNGNLIYYSACHGTGSLEEQIFSGFNKLRVACEQAGSSLNKVVKTNLMLTDSNHYAIMRRIETEYYQRYAPELISNPPACTYMQVEKIETTATVFQVDAIGVI
jgi:enamine deaminase RidA (YjgF/YER057c/UK114 family)